MTNGCPRPRMRWNGAIGAIARCKKESTVCAPKSRSRHELRLICGEKPGARGVATLFTPYMRHGQDESKQVPRSPRRNGLPVKFVVGALLMRHQHPPGALVELRQIGKTSSGTDGVLHHPPET